jgi:hypothetical protein
MWDAYSIIIHVSDTYQIVCEPLHVFSVYKTMISDMDCIVVLYKIQYQEKTTFKIIHSTVIPYYVSNGLTNRLRANLLFPMLCFSLKLPLDELPDGIYTDTLPQYGIVKYKLVENMDILKINKDLFGDTTVDVTYGITSVLPRIANILDLILSTSSTMFFQYQDDYTPFDLFRFVPLDFDSKEHYNILEFIRGEHRTLFRNKIAFQSENRHRGIVLKQLYLWNKVLTEENPIVIRTLKKLPMVPISFLEFNRVITNICKNQHIHQDYAYNYRIISELLHQSCLNRGILLDVLLQHNVIDIKHGKELSFLTQFGTCESLRDHIDSLEISFDTFDSIYKEIIRLEFKDDKPVFPKKEIDDIRALFMLKFMEFMDTLSLSSLEYMKQSTESINIKIQKEMPDFYSPFLNNILIELQERIEHEHKRIEHEHKRIEHEHKRIEHEHKRIEQEELKKYLDEYKLAQEFIEQERIETDHFKQDTFFDKHHRAELRSRKFRIKKEKRKRTRRLKF